METRVLIQSAPKPSAAFSLSQWCYTYNLIKIGQLAVEIFKFKSVEFSSLKGKYEWSDSAQNQTWPSFYSMLVLVTSNWNNDSIKNELASMETPFSHYKSMGNFFRHSRAAYSVVSGTIWPKFQLTWDFMHVFITCKYKAFCCHGHQSFDPICLKI